MTREFERPVIIRLVLAFVIATVVFVSMFLVAQSIAYLNYQYIVNQNNYIEESISDVENYLDNFVCEGNVLFEASEKLDVVGVRIGILEKRFGKHDSRVMEQKKDYSILEFRHFELIKKFSENCDTSFMTVLFFYSNVDDLEEESESFSYILESFKKKYPGKIMVYSYDYNLNSDLINDIKTRYGVDSAPVVVVNEGEAFYLRNIDELEGYLVKD